METIERIEADLRQELSEKRYLHSVGAMKMAEKLAQRYGIDSHIAALTGLVHDIGKELSDEEKLDYVKENQIVVDEIEEKNVGLLHAKIGADIAKKRYGFTKEMGQAIEYHTTGNPKMDLLAKITFIADKIEETRQYPQVLVIREVALENIDECMLMILSYDIKKNIDKNKLIHPSSILIRNQLLL